MSRIQKIIVSLTLLFVGAYAQAENSASVNQGIKIYHDLIDQGVNGTQLFSQFTSQFNRPPGEGGQCTGSWDCKWPANQCEGGWCVKPGGGGGECTGSWDCKWPANQCENGWCVKPGGDGGQCTGSWDCKWPANQCRNGYCVRP